MDWKAWARSVIFFSVAGWLFLYLVLRTQSVHPWSNYGGVNFKSAPWDVTFNTASSFLTNTNWQYYAGETTLTYFSQMIGLTVQNFLSAAYLALVPLELPLDVPLTNECEGALPLLEAVEQRAARAEVRVDSRIERGRSVRHALANLIAHERFEQMVVAAAIHRQRGDGFTTEDVAWLRESAPGEVIALRPSATFVRR
jgi:hypothetical protein